MCTVHSCTAYPHPHCVLGDSDSGHRLLITDTKERGQPAGNATSRPKKVQWSRRLADSRVQEGGAGVKGWGRWKSETREILPTQLIRCWGYVITLTPRTRPSFLDGAGQATDCTEQLAFRSKPRRTVFKSSPPVSPLLLSPIYGGNN